ncbi:MAG: hypothetical protein K2X03_21050 [Bryobacteraceae bacterium]|nr:hypothetical protein [Bryobacteraceae bacterium]
MPTIDTSPRPSCAEGSSRSPTNAASKGLCLSQASERLNRQGIDRARAVIERRLRRYGQRTDELVAASLPG